MRKLFFTAALFAWTLLGADLSGIWVGQIPTRNDQMQDIAFQFSQKGDLLGGKLYGDYGSTRITEGKVIGDQIDFVLVTSEQAGNQINEMRFHFTGTISASGEMELTREREGARNAGNGGVVQLRGDAKRTFKLKRLL
jgi:hypothetical protein